MNHLLKAVIAFALCLFCCTLRAEMVFYESFGKQTGNNSSTLDLFTGFLNTDVTYSSNLTDAAIVNSANSSGKYEGASGGANVLLGAENDRFSISGIDTSGYNNLFLRFGGYENLNGNTNVGLNGSMVDIEFTTDNGVTWNGLAFTDGDSNGWSSTRLSTPVSSLPSVSSLGLRFTNTIQGDSDIRFDDVSIEGVLILSVPEPTAFLMFGGAILGISLRRRR